MTKRLIRAEEAALVRRLLEFAGPARQYLLEQLEAAEVFPADDKGMGSIRFALGDGEAEETAARGVAVDSDGVELDIGLEINARGYLFALRIWKLDHSAVKQFPAPEDVEEQSGG